MELIDIGANLTKDTFTNLDKTLTDAYNYWVSNIIITGTSLEGSQKALDIVNKYNDKLGVKLYSTAGCHPHNANNFKSIQPFEKLLSDDRVVSIGECGLDYDRMFSPKNKQIETFKTQLELSEKYDKPVFLHDRMASEDFINVIKNYKVKGVVHCYTGNTEIAKKYLDMGFYIGITGWINDERRNRDLKRALPKIPLDRLMVETDSPFLTPIEAINDTGVRQNSPCNLSYVVDKMSHILNVDSLEIAKQTTHNAKTLFKLNK